MQREDGHFGVASDGRLGGMSAFLQRPMLARRLVRLPPVNLASSDVVQTLPETRPKVHPGSESSPKLDEVWSIWVMRWPECANI